MEQKQTLTITVAFFESLEDMRKFVDRSISETTSVLGETYAKTEEIRKRYESNKGDQLRGGKKSGPSSIKQKEVAGFRVLVNPTPEYELKLIEESVATLQERIEMLEKTKELYPALDKQGARIAMVLDEGVPSGFMFFGPDL